MGLVCCGFPQTRLFICLLPERTMVSCKNTVKMFDEDLVFKISAVVCIYQGEVECESFNVVSSVMQIFFLRDVNLTYFFLYVYIDSTNKVSTKKPPSSS